jgi:hypothetical protein
MAQASPPARADKIGEVDAFNIVAGLVGIAGLFFSVWVWLDAKRKEAVEAEKSVTSAYRLADMLSVVNAVAQQTALAANLADRDEVTKKELKHLLVANLTTLKAAQEGLARLHATGEAWQYGLTDTYLPQPGVEERPPGALTP